MDLLQGQISGQLMNQLAGQLGGNQQQTSSVVNDALSALMTGISKNAASKDGLSSLMGALDNDHDGSIFDDLAGFIGGSKKPENSRMLNGSGILKHVLGGSQNDIAGAISKNNGIEQDKASNLLATLAPVVMGMLGKVKKEQGLNAGSILGVLGEATKSDVVKSSAGLFSQFLDKDGDGSIVDDLVETGAKSLLGRLFGRK